jgi:hypothetical protein
MQRDAEPERRTLDRPIGDDARHGPVLASPGAADASVGTPASTGVIDVNRIIGGLGSARCEQPGATASAPAAKIAARDNDPAKPTTIVPRAVRFGPGGSQHGVCRYVLLAQVDRATSSVTE